MGWKASAIIIHKPAEFEKEKLLIQLGFENLTKIDDEPFEVAVNPKNDNVYIGVYKDNLLICAPDISMQFFEKQETPMKKALNDVFPNAEICSIMLHSTVNLWGYSVTKNGQKIRVRAGSTDDGTFMEIGEPLEEEKELLSRSKLDEKGNRIYLFDDFPDKPFSEDQVGENFVFAICKRYFDEELNCVDELLFETILTGYKYKTAKVMKKNKPWWKFW